MNYRYKVKVYADPKFYSNAVVFATRGEAENAARDKAAKWGGVADWQIEETDDPANYKFENERLVPLKENV